jgi:hypothetical protein
MPSYSKNDPRVVETRKHLKQLSRRLTGPIEVSDYLEYRSKHANHLPSVDTLLKMFSSWDNLLRACEIDPENGSEDLSRIPDSVLIKALQHAAADLDVSVLSSHAYDRWRSDYIASGKEWHKTYHDPPSSSVIRKWLGYWGDSVAAAGLAAHKRSSQRRPSTIEIIAALTEAKSRVSGMLSQVAYQRFVEELPEEERKNFPTFADILSSFPTWETALRAADVEQSDSLHPEGLWTAEECRRIARQSEVLLGEPLNEDNYQLIINKSKTPKPSWEVLQSLLSQ